MKIPIPKFQDCYEWHDTFLFIPRFVRVKEKGTEKYEIRWLETVQRKCSDDLYDTYTEYRLIK